MLLLLVLSHNALSGGKVLGTYKSCKLNLNQQEQLFKPTSIISHGELHIQELGQYKAAPPLRFFTAGLCQLRPWIAFRHLF